MITHKNKRLGVFFITVGATFAVGQYTRDLRYEEYRREVEAKREKIQEKYKHLISHPGQNP